MYGTSVIVTLSTVFDSFVIGATLDDGMAKVGIFTLAYTLTSLIQAPQRGIIAATIPHLARAWKDKNMQSIQNIYHRSSINQLIFAVLILILITLNYQNAVITFKLKADYLLGFNAFVILGLTRLVDMGTGVNAQIIGTSNYWRFELLSGLVLLVLMLPLNYLLTKRLDIIGPSLANLISFSIYNMVRVVFLWKKFRLFPFTMKSLYTILLGLGVYIIAWLLFDKLGGWTGLFARSIFVLILFATGIFFLKPSPDIKPVLDSLLDRVFPGRKRK
ncbi:polysaccharide biosynthesis C-terminal domain-containing protein [Niabella hibiscisoli]|uniref:polysaccharide biosynthesis C-terminal domain-containing protein n=1 Tax=Niabella hibiscisoli TaxID=1825928 RepID=UPI001F0EEF14|nr:oligosaccharide flippase family protein [Niabella hibiscisoli]MCH5716996.1 polysaccharide biosynthesis C-terminal domain-containing protein [Niabella hibiscisoli]